MWLLMKNKKTMAKKAIVDKIHKKIGRALDRHLIADAINVICSIIQDKLLKDQAISVENFGTLYSYFFHEHLGMDVTTGRLRKVKSFRTVKFRPHAVFWSLVAQRKSLLGGRRNEERASRERVDRSGRHHYSRSR